MLKERINLSLNEAASRALTEIIRATGESRTRAIEAAIIERAERVQKSDSDQLHIAAFSRRQSGSTAPSKIIVQPGIVDPSRAKTLISQSKSTSPRRSNSHGKR